MSGLIGEYLELTLLIYREFCAELETEVSRGFDPATLP